MRYLTTEEVIDLHRQIMFRTGDDPAAVRDRGLLESALARARNAALYEDADLAAQAVKLAAGIVWNHPFVDGNKRAGLFVMTIFLEANGQTITSADDALFTFAIDLATHAMSEDEFAALVRSWLVPVPPDE